MNNYQSQKTPTRTSPILKTPSQDARGRWYELLSPTQVLTGQQQQQQQRPEPEQPQKLETEKHKKKCRGDRKSQRRRRRLRRKGLDPDTITESVNQKLNLQQQQCDEPMEEDIRDEIQLYLSLDRVMCTFLINYSIKIFIS